MPHKGKPRKEKPVQIGLNVRQARRDKKMSQKELADRLDMTRQQLSYIEQGNNSKVQVYYDIAVELNMTFEELAGYHKRSRPSTGEQAEDN